MLVSVFAGGLVMGACQKSVEERYRFFSYGDFMLLAELRVKLAGLAKHAALPLLFGEPYRREGTHKVAANYVSASQVADYEVYRRLFVCRSRP